MPRFSANLFLFLDRPFLDRFYAAAARGFKGVEFHFPYDFPMDEVADVARRAGVEVVLFNFPAGNWAAGERGIACLPTRVAEFRRGVDQAMVWAGALGCGRVNCLGGAASGRHFRNRPAYLIGNLRFAADSFGPAGRQVLFVLNSRDTPRFLADRSAWPFPSWRMLQVPQSLPRCTTSFMPR